MTQLLRTNPGLIIGCALLAGGAIVCTLLALIMSRSGASLRPIYWFAGFFALIALPQIVGHFVLAKNTLNQEAPRVAALDKLTTAASPQQRTEAAKHLFGPDADPSLILDVRQKFGDLFASADVAQFATLPTGDTVLLARFRSYTAAEKAWVAYLQSTGLAQANGTGDSQRGYAVTRPVGDRLYALHTGNLLGVWTGKDDAAIRKRMLAGGFTVPRRAPLAAATDSGPDTPNTAAAASPLRAPLIAAALTLYLLLVVVYFFKGAAWAGSAPPKPGTTPLPAPELAARLQSINDLDVPFHLERGTDPDEFFVTWRYADAKWVDLARARGTRRTFRIRLTLDPSTHQVRATDYTTSYDWSAGRGGADLHWQSQLGIVFFQTEHQRTLGLQLDDQGRPKPDLSHTYHFNLSELKSPLLQTVTTSGWTWRPTIWQGPTWLRWLTE